jgi:type VI protein secretion system component VasF
MKDNSSQEEKSVDITIKDEDNKEDAKEATLPRKGATPKPRSSGRGLYITAIVLGIIIVLLLVLYIYLAITHQKPSHAFITPLPAITWISKG